MDILISIILIITGIILASKGIELILCHGYFDKKKKIKRIVFVCGLCITICGFISIFTAGIIVKGVI